MKILLYSEYIVQQGLWLQRKDEKRTNYGTNSIQFFIDKYISYLWNCNVRGRLIGYISSYRKKVNISGSFGEMDKAYSQEVEDNIVEIIDYMVTNYND